MERIRVKDISASRIKTFILNRVFSSIYFIFYFFNKDNISKIKNIKNKQKNKTIYILANGPSLNKVNFDFLKDKFTIGLNRATLLNNMYDFSPSVLVSVNDLVINQWANEFINFDGPLFVPYKFRKLFKTRTEETLYFNCSLGLRDKFSKNFSRYIYTGGTVTYVALQLATLYKWLNTAKCNRMVLA